MSGPSHGSVPPVRAALCHAVDHRGWGTRMATLIAVSRTWVGYGSPDASMKAGRLWAVNTTSTSGFLWGREAMALSTKPASRSR